MKNLGVGYEFTARKTFPFLGVGKRGWQDNEEVVDIKTGEKAKIIGYDVETDIFRLLNVSLDNENAWFELNRDDILKLQRKGVHK